MSMDLLDLFGGAANPGKKDQKDKSGDGGGAPIELMSQVDSLLAEYILQYE